MRGGRGRRKNSAVARKRSDVTGACQSRPAVIGWSPIARWFVCARVPVASKVRHTQELSARRHTQRTLTWSTERELRYPISLIEPLSAALILTAITFGFWPLSGRWQRGSWAWLRSARLAMLNRHERVTQSRSLLLCLSLSSSPGIQFLSRPPPVQIVSWTAVDGPR